MANKRNTKMVLASLLATSAIVPAISTSAEVGGDITRSGDAVTTSVEATPISAEEVVVKLSYNNPMAANFLPSTGTLLEDDGAAFIIVELPETTAAALTSVKVDGKEVLIKSEEGNIVLLPFTDGVETIAVSVESSFGPMELVVTPEFQVENDTDEETDTEDVDAGEEAPEEVAGFAPLKYLSDEYGEIADGEYPVEIDFVDLKDETTGYAPMVAHIESSATLVVEDGEYYLDIQATQRSNGMITDYYLLEDEETTLESIEGSKDEYPHTVRVPLAGLNGYTEMAVHVYAERDGQVMMDKPYPFGIMVKPGLALPELTPTYVYKEGTNELSIMQETYLSSTSVVADNGDGTYLVDLTFPKGQFLVSDLIFNGQTYAATEETEDEKGNTVSVYTVEVDDLSKIYSATFDLDVPGMYKAKHTAQIQFGGEKNPFGDISKNWAYSHVVSLYNKGIFAKADKFNPSNNLQRGHFALMLARAFELEVPATSNFTDLPTKDAEQVDAIKALNAYGIINGKTATTFVPSADIKRFEAALMIDRVLNKYSIEADATKTVNFSDISNTTAEAQAAIKKLASLEIINGKGDGKFDPKGTLTRAEMAKILDNALKIIEKQ